MAYIFNRYSWPRNKGPESNWIIILLGRSREEEDVVEYMEEPYIHEYGTILLQLYTVDGSIIMMRQNNEISVMTSTPTYMTSRRASLRQLPNQDILMDSKMLSFEMLEVMGDDLLDKNWNQYKQRQGK
ncbi:hypothetical protein EDD18DRAFT_1100884 [Armillaria luteobubalina]|uniref:Uncharacterized protein n=1 Tax=Armillaria luteobubalina TaxID=153913 RepID=A0AA39V229_9AGAR|nr:hypothetical protein EDD18DRAFT_1100884 [Armillaria luteobubalina]